MSDFARHEEATRAAVEARRRTKEESWSTLYEVNATIVVESDDPYEAAAYVRTILNADPEFVALRVGSAHAVRRTS